MITARNSILVLSILLCASVVNAQRLTNENREAMQAAEKHIMPYAISIVRDSLASDRMAADSSFIRLLVKALQTPYSFYYPFDSLITISKIVPADSSFKIFTWQIDLDGGRFRQKGAIQMNTPDGSLKLFPLFDVSDFTDTPNDSVRSISNWIGAIYYGIVTKEYNGKRIYTVFGYDDNNDLTTKKWLDVLTFTNGVPSFGGNFFGYKNDDIKPRQPVSRFSLEYKKNGRARMLYDPELDLIIFDHLISESRNTQDKSTLVPDGDYEGFKWMNGQWVHISKVFNEQVDMRGVDPILGNAPLPMPIKGNTVNSLLVEDEPDAPAKTKKESKKKKN